MYELLDFVLCADLGTDISKDERVHFMALLSKVMPSFCSQIDDVVKGAMFFKNLFDFSLTREIILEQFDSFFLEERILGLGEVGV